MKLKYFLQKYSLDFYLHPNIIKAVEEWLKQPNMTIEKALKELKEK